MFGTIICNTNKLTQDERQKYRAFYCGLCRAIKKNHGQIERFTLNYDMTFLAMLLNALYEENHDMKTIYCPVHPFSKQQILQNKYIDYAADMTILLAYYKCMDDWEDEKKYTGKIYGGLLRRKMEQITSMYPRQTACVQNSLRQLNEMEKSRALDVDEIVNVSGKMLSEIFVYKEDFWSLSSRNIGYELGRFIYLMDAALDYEKDRKKGNYNPLIRMNKKPIDLEAHLEEAISNVAIEFEKLPIVQDVNILRNIIYGGVWQLYDANIKGKENKDGKRSV